MKGTASMTMLADTADAVIGVDTHTGTHTACLLDRLGRHVATVAVTADPEGFRMLQAWAARHAPGPQLAWAVEGTRSHGLGLARMLQASGQVVVEAPTSLGGLGIGPGQSWRRAPGRAAYLSGSIRGGDALR
jgi:hypothetical protein